MNSVGYQNIFKDGSSVGDSVTRVTNETSRPTGGVEGQYGVVGNIDILNLESLEHYGNHLLTVGLGVFWSFCKKNTFCFFRCKSDFVVESMMPDLLNVLPGLDDTCSDGLLQVENASFL